MKCEVISIFIIYCNKHKESKQLKLMHLSVSLCLSDLSKVLLSFLDMDRGTFMSQLGYLLATDPH